MVRKDKVNESKDSFYIVEAKAGNSPVLIRQLFFPYSFWKEKVDKKIKCVVFSINKNIFELCMIEFDGGYNNYRIIKHEKFRIKGI